MKKCIAVGVVALLAAACGPEAHDRAAPQQTVTVRTAPAAMTDVRDRLEAGGVVAANASAVLSSRIVAPVLTVAVRAGDAARAGQVLVTLDARDAAAQARQATAAVVAAEQGLMQARSDEAAAAADRTLAAAYHARISTLHARNSATTQELDEANARLAGAAARMSGAQAAIAQASAQLDALRAAAEGASVAHSFTEIRAPFAGVVTERLTDPGNLAAPGVPLIRIDAGGRRRVDVDVDEHRAAYLQPGDPATLLVGADRVEGTIVEIARAVAADRRAFTVKVALPDGAAARSGTFARVQFRGPSRRALLIPAAAVRRQGQVTSAFVVRDGKASIRLLQLGESREEGVEVRAGLEAGEDVVVAPPPVLADGQPVTIAAARGVP